MMNNFDKLSLLSEKQDENAVKSVIQPKAPAPEAPKKRPTIFTALFANFKQDKDLLYPSKGAVLPKLTGTLGTLVTLVFLSAVMVALWYFIDKVAFIPIALVFLSISIPCFITVFYYEFDVGMTIPVGKLFLLMVIGALCYIIISQIMSEFLYIMLYQTIVDSVIMPVISNVVMFAVIFLSANFFKGETVRDYFVVVAFLTMGYVMCENLTKGFSALFISSKIDETTLYNIKVIVGNEDMLTLSMQNLLKNLVYDYIIIPILYSCWGTVYAYLVYYLMDSRKKKNTIPKSMYLLVLLVIILNILALVDTSMVSFNIILRFISCVLSIYILIKLLNFSFDEEPPQKILQDTAN